MVDGGNTGPWSSHVSKVTFGYRTKLGIAYPVYEKIDLFLEGVYQSTKVFEIDGNNVNPLVTPSAKLGTRIKF